MDDAEYQLPFRLDALFADVWDRAFDGRVDAFYLSINPTKALLHDPESQVGSAPSGQLLFGTGVSEAAKNQVVTAGDIDGTRIGRILWEADVAFKSASLGFDVFKGRSAQPAIRLAAGSDDASEQSADDVPMSDRWCRLYWTSGDQAMTLDRSTLAVRFKGDAVVAKAEAMELKGEELVPARGSWCRDSSAVARDLQRRANSAAESTGVLAELRRVAQFQTFASWARAMTIPVDESAKRLIAAKRSPQNFRVPTWTSGITSQKDVLVQQERRREQGRPSFLVHVRYSDHSVWDDCVLAAWARQEVDFPKAGYSHNRQTDTWEGRGKSLEEGTFLPTWMNGLADRIARCAKGRVLPTNDLLPSSAVESAEDLTSFGVIGHTAPVNYQGGVLLSPREGGNALQSALEHGTLIDPQGHLLFKRDGDALHLWSRTRGEGRRGASHVAISNGHVLRAFARDGRLRILVGIDPGGIVRSELRVEASARFTKGLEWLASWSGQDGLPLLALAAWPCNDSASDPGPCVRTEIHDQTWIEGSLARDNSFARLVHVEHVGEAVWLVDLDISDIGDSLDARHAESTTERIRLAQELSYWGFTERAEELIRTLEEEMGSDQQDVVLASAVGTDSVRDVIAEFALAIVTKRLDAEIMDDSAEARQLFSESAPKLATMLQQIDPRLAAPMLERLARDAAVFRLENTKPRGAGLSYASLARQTRALAGQGKSDLAERIATFDEMLSEHEGRKLQLALTPNQVYSVKGGCDPRCEDLKLELRTSDGMVIASREDFVGEAFDFKATDATSYELSIEMGRCRAPNCEAVIYVVEGDSGTGDLDLLSATTGLFDISGGLQTGEVHRERLVVEGGKSYAIAGGCDRDCTGLSLAVENGDGVKVAAIDDFDFGSDPLTFTVDIDEEYWAVAKMQSCTVASCTFGLQLTEVDTNGESGSEDLEGLEPNDLEDREPEKALFELAGDLVTRSRKREHFIATDGGELTVSGGCDTDCAGLNVSVERDDGVSVLTAARIDYGLDGASFPSEAGIGYWVTVEMQECDQSACSYQVGIHKTSRIE